MSVRGGWWLIGAGLCASASAHAFQLQQIDTHYERGEYRLTMTATLNAPMHQVEAVLRDYAHYPELDNRILTARVSAGSAGETQLFTRIHVCMSFLCRNVERLERVQVQPGELSAVIIPERSDAERGETHTMLFAEGMQTRVQYTTFIVPKFWVPAWFGRASMLRTLRDGSVSLFQHVEKRAAEMIGPSD